MAHVHRVFCVLCQRLDETNITGTLSTKDQVTAHQNCLLFSSGIFCRDSPQFDDLFGFSVDDVKNEVKRGSKLVCSKCKKKGATAGCEVKRCSKSFHYPCAVQDGATTVEDEDKGNYALYCLKHSQQKQGKTSTVNGCASSVTKPQTSKCPSEARPSKVNCLTCEKTEGNTSFEDLSKSVTTMYCDKHAPRSLQRNGRGESTAAGPSAYRSDSTSSSSTKRPSLKRRLSFDDKQPPSKQPLDSWAGVLTEDSSDSDEPDKDMAIFAPLESDIDASAESASQLIREETLTGHTSDSKLVNGSREEIMDEDQDEDDAESLSLLLPVRRSAESPKLSASTQTAPTTYPSAVDVKSENGESCPYASPAHSPDPRSAQPSVSGQSPTSSSPAPSKPVASPAILPARHESPGLRAALPSSRFWRSCNAAGCTQAIFTDFMKEMNNILGKIQTDQASQEDYDLALKVMEASGKLPELVISQQKELQRKQMELQKAAAAMEDVVSALRR